MNKIAGVGKVNIFGVALLIQLFFFLSAGHIWGQTVAAMFQMYFIMLAVSYVLLQVDNPLRHVSIHNGVIQYVAAFVVGLFVFTTFGLGVGNTDFGGFGTLTLLVLAQSVCVGLSEELIFRGAIPKAMQVSGFSYTVSRIIAAVSFAIFHGWAYNWEIAPIVAAFCFSCLMQFIWDGGIRESATRRNGYPLAAVGLHAAWNVVVMSPFTILAGVI
jgi:CAAX amino terminal protease family.